MKRTFGIVFTALVEFAFGLLFLAIGASVLFVLAIGSGPGKQAFTLLQICTLSGFYVLLGGGAIATGVGVWQRRQWGRILTLIAAGMLTITGVLASATTALMPIPQGVADARVWTGVRTVMMVVFVGLAILGVSWIFLFTRLKMRDQFVQAAQSRGEAVDASGRPLSIVVLGWFLAVSSLLGVAMQLLLHYPAVLLWMVISGFPAVLVQVVWGIVAFFVGVGLLKTYRWAWNLCIVVIAFGALNGAIFFLMPGRELRIQRMFALMPNSQQMSNSSAQMQMVTSPAFYLIIVLVSLGIPLYFLLSRRKRYMAIAR